LSFYERELLNEKLLCPQDWAGGIAWALAPNVELALDARGSAVAGAATTAALQAALAGGEGWREALLDHQVEACLLPLGSPLAINLAGPPIGSPWPLMARASSMCETFRWSRS